LILKCSVCEASEKFSVLQTTITNAHVDDWKVQAGYALPSDLVGVGLESVSEMSYDDVNAHNRLLICLAKMRHNPIQSQTARLTMIIVLSYSNGGMFIHASSFPDSISLKLVRKVNFGQNSKQGQLYAPRS